MLRKAHEAKIDGSQMEIWGTGSPRREFMYVDDAVEALARLIEFYSHEEPINVAGAQSVTIRELAHAAAACVGFEGEIRFDTSKPDGMPRKTLDASKMRNLGWTPRWQLVSGLRETYRWFLQKSSQALIYPSPPRL